MTVENKIFLVLGSINEQHERRKYSKQRYEEPLFNKTLISRLDQNIIIFRSN